MKPARKRKDPAPPKGYRIVTRGKVHEGDVECWPTHSWPPWRSWHPVESFMNDGIAQWWTHFHGVVARPVARAAKRRGRKS